MRNTQANNVIAIHEGIDLVGTHCRASVGVGRRREAADPARLLRAKKAYGTRYFARSVEIDASGYQLLTGEGVHPFAGALVLAKIVSIGQHTGLQGPQGRRQTIFPGDEIVVAYGNRYAPDQFEAYIPDGLTVTNLVAAGGVAADAHTLHARMKPATVIEPLGLIAGPDGKPLSLTDYAPHRLNSSQSQPRALNTQGRPPVIAVLGSSMNSGKTTTLAHLVHGLANAGLRVHAGKATGTGAWGDPGLFRDAGASQVLDFTDFGYPTTFRIPHTEILDLFTSLRQTLAVGSPGAVVIEIADGLYQEETSRLIADPAFARQVDGVVFAAGEALGAVGAVRLLENHGLPVRAVSGRITASPLAAREAQTALHLPVIPTFDLGQPEISTGLLETESAASLRIS